MPSEMTPAQKLDFVIYGGSEAVEAHAKLEACLAEVERKHQEYFNSLESRYSTENDKKPARLHEFCILQWDTAIGAKMWLSPDLPQNIADECRACFAELSK